jgi:hypothetical protein
MHATTLERRVLGLTETKGLPSSAWVLGASHLLGGPPLSLSRPSQTLGGEVTVVVVTGGFTRKTVNGLVEG